MNGQAQGSAHPDVGTDRVTRQTFCRICPAFCGLLVDIEDGKVVRSMGDRHNPLSSGYSCPKGRRIGDLHSAPDRLLSSVRRAASGEFEPVDVGVALEDIGRRLSDIIAEHGPDSVALYHGTQVIFSPSAMPFIWNWFAQTGSRKQFSTMTIDQSAQWVTAGRLGTWEGGRNRFDDVDVCFVVGGNPFVSQSWSPGVPAHGGRRRLLAAQARGLKLVVVDPRRSDLAATSDYHLQNRPGTDAVLLGGMLRFLLDEGLYDREFCSEWVEPLSSLRAQVEALTPAVVADFCGVDEDLFVDAVRCFGEAKRGKVGSGTGCGMGPWSNLTQHLVETINVVCGRFPRAGEPTQQMAVLGRSRQPRAQVRGPNRTWEHGYQSRFGFGLFSSEITARPGAELPTSTLPDEILDDAGDRVRALVVIGGNPISAIPDQEKTSRALESLELLVTVDPFLTETARMSDYVIAPAMSLEQADHSLPGEAGFPVPYAQYTPAILPAPPGVIPDWEIFARLAHAMGYSVEVGDTTLPAGTIPSTDEVLDLLTSGSVVPLDEVRQHPHGKVFDLPPVVVAEPDPGQRRRFDVMPADVEQELRSMVAAATAGRATETRPVRLVVRRAKKTMNSLGRRLPTAAREGYNPCFAHPDDMSAWGVRHADRITLTSDHGSVEAIVHADTGVRPGSVSMSHCFGDGAADDDPREFGTNPNRLLSLDHDLTSINAMPLMSAVPVTITRSAQT